MDKWFNYHISLFNDREFGNKKEITEEQRKTIQQNVLGNEDLNNLIYQLIIAEIRKLYQDGETQEDSSII